MPLCSPEDTRGSRNLSLRENTMKTLFIFGCLIALAGCKAERSPSSLYGPDASGMLVVDAVLIVDRPLPALPITQTTTLAPSENWWNTAARYNESAVTDAEVTIAQGDQRFLYSADPEWPGWYVPPPSAPHVLPNAVYELRVQSQGREASAQTRTPDRLDIREAVLLDDETFEVLRVLKKFEDGGVFSAPENQVPYQFGLLEARFDPLSVGGYQISIESLDRGSDYLIVSDLFEEGDIERYGSSPALEAADGNLRMPWFIVGFAGRHMLRVYAVDKNWFDLIRSVPEFFQDDDDNFFQPGGLAGDNFERPLFHIEGGIGLFGSASVDSLGFVVLPR